MRYCFGVTSPTWEYVDYIADLGGGPTEIVASWTFVWARTKRDAIRAGVRFFAHQCGRDSKAGRRYTPSWACCWTHYARREGTNPFTGVRADRIDGDELAEIMGVL